MLSIQKGVRVFRGLPFYPVLQNRVKYTFCSIVLSVLGSAFEVVSKRAPEFNDEISTWEDGRRFAIGILSRGPYITLEKRGDAIRFLGKGLLSPEISMFFKNLDAAIPVFLGLKGSFQVFAENGMLVDGNLSHTMEVNRVANIVNAYLFPGIMLKNVLKRTPRFNLLQLTVKARVYIELMPAFLWHAARN